MRAGIDPEHGSADIVALHFTNSSKEHSEYGTLLIFYKHDGQWRIPPSGKCPGNDKNWSPVTVTVATILRTGTGKAFRPCSRHILGQSGTPCSGAVLVQNIVRSGYRCLSFSGPE